MDREEVRRHGRREREEIARRGVERGRERAKDDYRAGAIEPGAPLSGEWAGESVPELLGDLIADYIGTGADEVDAFEWACEDYEQGYWEEWGLLEVLR